MLRRGERKRAQRCQWTREAFPKIESMSVIDLGGTAEAWLRAAVQRAQLHVVNLEPPANEMPSWIRADQADACDLPARSATGIRPRLFHSVIEHVGGHAQRMRFADAVHKLAERHWVQILYRYFPIEPRWLFPRFQFLPLNARGQLAQRWGGRRRAGRGGGVPG